LLCAIASERNSRTMTWLFGDLAKAEELRQINMRANSADLCVLEEIILVCRAYLAYCFRVVYLLARFARRFMGLLMLQCSGNKVRCQDTGLPNVVG
jgi:hypothetical protein